MSGANASPTGRSHQMIEPIDKGSRMMRAISFVFRFIVLLGIVAYLEGNRDA